MPLPTSKYLLPLLLGSDIVRAGATAFEQAMFIMDEHQHTDLEKLTNDLEKEIDELEKQWKEIGVRPFAVLRSANIDRKPEQDNTIAVEGPVKVAASTAMPMAVRRAGDSATMANRFATVIVSSDQYNVTIVRTKKKFAENDEDGDK